MDKKDFTIGLLTTTATILLVGLLVIQTQPAPIFADGMTVTGGDYVMTVGAIVERDEEYVFVMDIPTEKMIAYHFDSARGQISVAQGIDLKQLSEQNPNSKP